MKKIITILISAIILILPSCVESTMASNGSTVAKNNINVVNTLSSILKSKNVAMYKESMWKEYGKPNITRKLKNNLSYEIRNEKDGSKLYIFYVSEIFGKSYKNRVYDMWRLKKLLRVKDFKKIKIKKSNANDVNKIDPYCGFVPVAGGKVMSETRLENNKSIIISYAKKGKEWRVSKIKYVKTALKGFKTLTSKDLAEISK